MWNNKIQHAKKTLGCYYEVYRKVVIFTMKQTSQKLYLYFMALVTSRHDSNACGDSSFLFRPKKFVHYRYGSN